jgi:hypothetical protein
MNSNMADEGKTKVLRRGTATLILFVLGCVIYLGNAWFPALLDDADSSHAIVAREMHQRHDWVIPYMNGIRYLMKSPMAIGSRMEYYSFGGWPAIAMLLGVGLTKAEESGESWVTKMQAALVALGVILAGVLAGLLILSAKMKVHGEISTALEEHKNAFYGVSTAPFPDLTPQAFAYLRLPAAIAEIVFLLDLSAAWWLRRSHRALASTLSIAVTMAPFFFAPIIAFGAFSPYLSSKPVLESMQAQKQPEDALVICGEFDASSSVAFYTNRRLLIWNGRFNNLLAGSAFRRAPHFPDQWGVSAVVERQKASVSLRA